MFSWNMRKRPRKIFSFGSRWPIEVPEAASIDVLPTIWFRNTWSWGLDARKPQLAGDHDREGTRAIRVSHFDMAERWLLCEGSPELLFTDNETNFERLFGVANHDPYVKDGINDYVVGGQEERCESGKNRNQGLRSLPFASWRRADRRP